MSELLNAQGVTFAYHDVPALSSVSLSLAPGQIVALLGPNGSGKSTLLKVLLGHLPGEGAIQWDRRDLSSWRRRELARFVAYLPQSSTWEAGQTVLDALRLGRAPYWGALGLEAASDEKAVGSVAQTLGLAPLLQRRMDELSGGQRQRVLLGRCLVQQPKAMLLDEPNTFLDLKHQTELSQLLRDLAAQRQIGIVMASHDLNLAAMFADQVIVLREGQVAAMGPPADVLQPEMLARVYGLPMERIERAGSWPVLVPRVDREKNERKDAPTHR
jgi:ABC-type cobalamin/Fe3+-siderophores transport system ATPase subunit